MFFKKDEEEKSKAEQMLVKYKYRDLKVYSSDEWMSDSTKKYRRVFESSEITYMRVEFSFINKLFDEEEWEANICLKCFTLNGSNKNELCKFEKKIKVLVDENIVYVRESWGNDKPGSYWLSGDYEWEAYIEKEKVGDVKFYVENIGQVKQGDNPYFDIESFKFFEGDDKGLNQTNKKYLNKFSENDTRFVWGEFNFKNKTSKDYFCELIFNFYDAAGQPKGRSAIVKYVAVNTEGQVYSLFPSWGSNVAGTWSDNKYTCEVIFMETLIAAASFEVGTTFQEGVVSVLTDGEKVLKQKIQISSEIENIKPEELLEKSLAELNSLTGMTGIKQNVNDLVKLVRFYQETGKNVLNKFSLHSVFIGNPGTGKTTVARILASIYKGLGILEKGHLVEVDREGLVAGYVGQTAIKTNEKIEEALGGILFIDEAYSLSQGKGSQYDFGGEAIEIILKRMEDLRGKFGVIVAGYPENMQEFISSNPGLKSRFDSYFNFEDYSPEEMFTIALSIFKKEETTPDIASQNHLKEYFDFLYKNRDRFFGNARTVRQVVIEAVKNQNLRLASMKKEERTKEMLETIIFDDVKEFEIKENNSTRRVGFKFGENK